ncbi:MAG: hypothetical protein GY754_22590 [bacterium]|nr:hypothetical protein [bacterium]
MINIDMNIPEITILSVSTFLAAFFFEKNKNMKNIVDKYRQETKTTTTNNRRKQWKFTR